MTAARVKLTAEDTSIWCLVYLRAGRWPQFGVGPASVADQRDADLMLAAVRGDSSWWWNGRNRGPYRVLCRKEWFVVGGVVTR